MRGLTNLSSLDIKLTNGLVLDLNDFMNKKEDCTYDTFKTWVATLLGKDWPEDHPPSVKALRQSVIRLSNRLTKIKKERNSEAKDALIAGFLDEEYCLPRVLTSHDKPVSMSSSSSSTSPDWEKESLRLVNTELCKELSELCIKASELEHREEKLKKSTQSLYSKHRNDPQKLQRRERELQIKKKEITDGKKMVHYLEKDLKEQKSICR